MFTATSQFPRDEATFLKICHFAKTGNVNGLKFMFSHEVSVNLRDNKDRSPVMLLAQEKNTDAMWLLINKFNASINHALQGAAQANQKELIKALLEKGADICHALQGYGLSGNVDDIVRILKETPWYELLATRNVALQALARGGHLDKMKQLHKEWHQTLSFDYDYDSMPVAAVQGLAYSGNDTEVQKIITEIRTLRYAAIKGYAEAGRRDKVQELLKKDERLKFSAISGYIISGFYTEALALVSESVKEKSWLAGCFAAVGDVIQTEKILAEIGKIRICCEDLPFEKAAYGYCGNCDIARGFNVVTRFCDVDKILKDGKNTVEYRELHLCVLRIIDAIPNNYLTNENILLITLGLIDHKWLREQVLEGVRLFNDERKAKILEQAEEINVVIKLDSIFLDETMEYVKCETIPAFSYNLDGRP